MVEEWLLEMQDVVDEHMNCADLAAQLEEAQSEVARLEAEPKKEHDELKEKLKKLERERDALYDENNVCEVRIASRIRRQARKENARSVARNTPGRKIAMKKNPSFVAARGMC